MEQETNVLRARIHSLESENEKLSAENKRLSILKLNKKTCSQIKNDSRSKIACLEKRSKMAGIFIWVFIGIYVIGSPSIIIFFFSFF